MTENPPHIEDEIRTALQSERRGVHVPLWLAVVTSALLALLAAGLVMLIVIISNKFDDAQQDREATAEDTRLALEVADCRALFAANAAKLEQAQFNALMNLIKEEGRVIIETAAVHPPAPFDPMPILAAVNAGDDAKDAYETAVAASDQWVAAGSPLPCPVKAVG